jgi:hypothetical protein
MAKLISSVTQLIDQVRRFNEKADMFAKLIPYCRSWYALRTEDGWLLGPSKYIGYDLSPEEYLASPYSTEEHGRVMQRDKADMLLDGRVTEGVLRRWSDLVEEGHPDYDALHTTLNELCARYGKKPNTLARISIIKSEAKVASVPEFGDEFVSLMVAVYHKLTPAQKSAFRKQVA